MRITGILSTLTVVALLGISHESHSATAALGPFHFSLPIIVADGKGKAQDAVDVVTKAYGHSLLDVKVKDGMLTCFAGGDGPKALFRLGELQKVLAGAGVRCERSEWEIKAQEVGLCLSATNPISMADLDAALESIPGVEGHVIGSILDGSRLCVVLELEEAVGYDDLTRHLKSKDLRVDDFVWGHWKYGWKIEGEAGHRHGHDNGFARR